MARQRCASEFVNFSWAWKIPDYIESGFAPEVMITAARGNTFVIIIVAVTIKRVHIPKAARCNCNASYCLGRGEKKYDSKYCNVLAWGDSSEIKLRMSSLIS